MWLIQISSIQFVTMIHYQHHSYDSIYSHRNTKIYSLAAISSLWVYGFINMNMSPNSIES